MTEVIIHPNVNGPTHASTPYQRKLEEVRRQIDLIMVVAQADDVLALIDIRNILDELLRNK